jgi:hypothetical protein
MKNSFSLIPIEKEPFVSSGKELFSGVFFLRNPRYLRRQRGQVLHRIKSELKKVL